jgi:hypothetical protein
MRSARCVCVLVGLIAAILLVCLGPSPAGADKPQNCKGTKEWFRGKCRYADEIKRLKRSDKKKTPGATKKRVREDTKSSTRTTKKASFLVTVREVDRRGPLVEGAEVSIIQTPPHGGIERQLDSGTTDAYGRVRLAVPKEQPKTPGGKVVAVVRNRGTGRTVPLAQIRKGEEITLFVDHLPPADLMHVELRPAEGKIVVVPRMSSGADIVNWGGNTRGVTDKGTDRIELRCLSSALVGVNLEASGNMFLLPLSPSDDGASLSLRGDANAVVFYRDDVPVFLDWARATSETAKVQEEKGRKAADLFRKSVHRKLRQATRAAVRAAKKAEHRFVVVLMQDTKARLQLLRELEGSGAGLDLPKCEGTVSVSAVELRAIAKVKPFMVLAGAECMPGLIARLPALENLFIKVEKGQELPDLSGLLALKQLWIQGEERLIDLAPIRKLVLLQALTVMAGRLANAEVIGALPNLEFLVFSAGKDSKLMGWGEVSGAPRFMRLRHLVSNFKVSQSFSFVSSLPSLRTLGIANLESGHDLSPLAEHPGIQYVALGGDKFPKLTQMKQVERLRQRRPNIKIVELQGFCMGSFWLFPCAILAALLAWWVRRRLRRNWPSALASQSAAK